MKKLAIGQYYHADSFMHRMDPRVKLVLMFVFMVTVFLAKLPWGLIPVTALVVLAVAASHVPVRVIARACRPVLFFVVITFIANLALVHTGDVIFSLFGTPITWDGVRESLVLSYRIAALMLAGVMVALVTSPVGITDGIERLLSPLARLGLPVHEFAMMFTIAIRFVPTLSEELRHIVTAQTARGAAIDEGSLPQRAKVLVSMVVPLFASSIRHAEELASAMEARCYVGGEGRTHYHVLKLGREDAIAIAVFAVYLVALVLVGVLA